MSIVKRYAAKAAMMGMDIRIHAFLNKTFSKNKRSISAFRGLFAFILIVFRPVLLRNISSSNSLHLALGDAGHCDILKSLATHLLSGRRCMVFYVCLLPRPLDTTGKRLCAHLIKECQMPLVPGIGTVFYPRFIVTPVATKPYQSILSITCENSGNISLLS
jgi:hypothetical protein